MWSVKRLGAHRCRAPALLGAGCVLDLHRNTNLSNEAHDPTLGPFLALTTILLMVCGPAGGAHAEQAGRAVFLLGLVSLAALGSWLSGWWIVGDVRLDRWHPGYLLPTAIGGLVTAGSGALLGYRTLALLASGWGLISWVVIGSIVLAGLTLAAPLPPPLMPSLAILAAPPTAAADAWLPLGGDPRGLVVGGLAGYTCLMMGVQLCLVRCSAGCRSVPVGGLWSSPTQQSPRFALDWLARCAVPPAQRAGAVAVLVTVSVGIAVLAVRSTVAVLTVVLAAVPGQRTGRSAALSGRGRMPTMRAGRCRPEKES